MRKLFFEVLYQLMAKHRDIYVLTGDLGYGGFDQIRDNFPSRFVNAGAAEVAMMGIACGLALEGKIPFVYSITPFLLYRPFEVLRTYINYEKIPVIMIGSGRDQDYLYDGISHWSQDDKEVMKLFKNIQSFWPENKENIPDLMKEIINNKRPVYLNLRR